MPRAISGPRVPPQLTPVDLGRDGLLQDELAVLESQVTGRAEAVSARGLELHATRLDNVDLTGARLPQLELQDCLVSGGSLANVTARGGTVQRVRFEGTRLTGLSLHEGTLRDVTFASCLLDLTSFAAARLERVRFEECILTDVDLQDARLAAVVFDTCNLSGADLTGARLGSGCELHACMLSGIRSLDRLRGAAMPMDDIVASAPVLAAALGISVLAREDMGGPWP